MFYATRQPALGPLHGFIDKWQGWGAVFLPVKTPLEPPQKRVFGAIP
jgi:hypothetical protein